MHPQSPPPPSRNDQIPNWLRNPVVEHKVFHLIYPKIAGDLIFCYLFKNLQNLHY